MLIETSRLYTVAGIAVAFAFNNTPCVAGLSEHRFGNFKTA